MLADVKREHVSASGTLENIILLPRKLLNTTTRIFLIPNTSDLRIGKTKILENRHPR